MKVISRATLALLVALVASNPALALDPILIDDDCTRLGSPKLSPDWAECDCDTIGTQVNYVKDFALPVTPAAESLLSITAADWAFAHAVTINGTLITDFAGNPSQGIPCNFLTTFHDVPVSILNLGGMNTIEIAHRQGDNIWFRDLTLIVKAPPISVDEESWGRIKASYR